MLFVFLFVNFALNDFDKSIHVEPIISVNFSNFLMKNDAIDRLLVSTAKWSN